jgi:hypothetical protein
MFHLTLHHLLARSRFNRLHLRHRIHRLRRPLRRLRPRHLPRPRPRSLQQRTSLSGTAANLSTPSQSPSADLSVSSSLRPRNPYRPGDTVAFTLHITNAGPNAAAGIKLDQTLTNLKLSKNICTGLHCTLAPLNPGTETTFTVMAIVQTQGSFLLSSRVSHDGDDPNPANNLSTIGDYAEPSLQSFQRPKPPPPPSVPLWVWLAVPVVLAAAALIGLQLWHRAWHNRIAVTASLDASIPAIPALPPTFQSPPVSLHVTLQPATVSSPATLPILRSEPDHD